MRTDLLFDARNVGEHPHGIARFTLTCLAALAEGDPGFHTTVLVAVPYHPDFPPPRPWLAYRLDRTPCYSAREQVALPITLVKLRAKGYFSPTFSGPLGGTVPMAITIHDLIHLRFAKEYSVAHRLYYRRVVSPLVRRCRAIATVSETSRAEIGGNFPEAFEKTVVLGNLVDPAFSPARDAAAVRGRLLRMGIDAPYLLFVGNPKGHKNFAGLYRAFRTAGEEFRTLLLVVVGIPVADANRQGWNDPRVRFIAPQDSETLADLCRGAVMLVVPSFWEGFGLPAVEAMACQTPVVASDIPTFHEVLGDSALFVDPRNPDSLAGGIRRVLVDEALREKLARGGPAAAARHRDAKAFRERFLTLAKGLLARRRGTRKGAATTTPGRGA